MPIAATSASGAGDSSGCHRRFYLVDRSCARTALKSSYSRTPSVQRGLRRSRSPNKSGRWTPSDFGVTAPISCGILYNHESPRRGAAFVSQRVVEGLIAHRFDGAPELRLGSLSARVDWGYAPDYTLAMQRILETASGQDFVIATGVTHAVGDWVRVAAEYLGLDWRRCVSEDQSLLRRPSQELCGDFTRLHQATGWRPEVSFESMVRFMVDAALARRAGQLSVG